jgi:hypothetical protein
MSDERKISELQAAAQRGRLRAPSSPVQVADNLKSAARKLRSGRWRWAGRPGGDRAR